ncbi:MAG: hypothetical protein KJ060_17665 [Candidatus Hydrogenedentes bacterium]|nr:hypothetical protein [Candidatus Hydrogenedentota bacterium]
MRIQSPDRAVYVDLEVVTQSGYPFLNAIAQFGEFYGERHGITLSNLPGFIAELDRFVLDHSLSPELHGSYGFSLRIFSKSAASPPRVRCEIGSEVSHPEGNRKFGIYGEFELESEYVTSYAREFSLIAKEFGIDR